MKNEVAVVVGVGPGLGAALVKRFAKEGFTTIAVARRASSLTSLRGGDDPVILYDCDATVPEQVELLFHKIQSDYGLLCITVFNAGAFERREVVETDPADFERCWRIGCFAGFLVGKAAARVMLKQGQGTILFTGATASLRGSAGFVNLAALKFALRALAQSMARELDLLILTCVLTRTVHEPYTGDHFSEILEATQPSVRPPWLPLARDANPETWRLGPTQGHRAPV